MDLGNPLPISTFKVKLGPTSNINIPFEVLQCPMSNLTIIIPCFWVLRIHLVLYKLVLSLQGWRIICYEKSNATCTFDKEQNWPLDRSITHDKFGADLVNQ